MKFDYCIGNPPFNGETAGDNKTNMPPIYHLFMDEAYKMADTVELITPARFLSNSGDTPKAWNEKMLNDEHFKVLYFEPDSSKVFANKSIKGGVAVSIRSAEKKYGAIEIFTAFKELNSILDKVHHRSDFESFSSIVGSQSAYRLTNTFHKEHPEARYKEDVNGNNVGLLAKGHDYDVGTKIFDRLPLVFLDADPKDGHEYIRILGRQNNGRATKYVRRDYIGVVDSFSKFKVFLPKANGSGAIGEVLTTPLIGEPLIGEPLIGHTQTFISIGCFANIVEAQNCMKYIESKFARTVLGILKTTPDNPSEKWKYVPLQDFTPASDIDWSQSVAEIDRQLYRKYGLSEDEIQFIETHVKEMN